MASGYLNKVQIMGNLGRDPEVRTFQSGGKVCNLRVATSKFWKDRSTGEKRERTEWHSVSVYQDSAVRFLEQYARKGSKVFIEGSLETRKWQDQSGQDRYTTEIAVRPFDGEVQILSNWANEDQQGRSQQGGYNDRSQGQGDNRQGRPWYSGSDQYTRQDDLNDEIPF